MEPRLKSGFWVKAHVRRCTSAGVTATVARRGDPDAGDILIKINRLDGTFAVLARARRGDGGLVWIRGTGPTAVAETDADAYVSRQLKIDPDLWILEIEDREGRHFIDEPVE